MLGIAPAGSDPRCEWLPAERSVRVVVAGVTVAESDDVMLLRQHGFLPVFYFPRDDVVGAFLEPAAHQTKSPYKGRANYFDVVVGDRRRLAAAWTYPDPLPRSPDTRGYFGFDWHAMDSWWEEDERALVHARDPFLRVDALASGRHVVVRVGGEVVADTHRPKLVLETGLVARWYIPLADVRVDVLRASGTFSLCPYKGRASYVTVRAGDRLHEDVAWSYVSPRPALAAITEHLSFWTDRADVEVTVDGDRVQTLGMRDPGGGAERLAPSRRFFAVPAPAAMVGAVPGGLQHDHARPNGRAEGPPDAALDLAASRAGGRRVDWPVPSSPWAASEDGLERVPLSGASFFTFGADPDPPTARPSRRWVAADGSVLEDGLRAVRALVDGRTLARAAAPLLLTRPGQSATWAFAPTEVTADLPRLTPAIEGLPLDDLVVADPAGVDAWLEEDELVREVRSPYVRAETLSTRRPVTIDDGDGNVLAQADAGAVTLHVTGRPVWFFVAPAVVRVALHETTVVGDALVGQAATLALRVGGEPVARRYATPEPAAIAVSGLIGFDPGRVNVRLGPRPVPAAP